MSHFGDAALQRLPISKGVKLLDVGTGTGALALQAAALGATVDAIDIAEEPIASLTQLIATSEPPPPVTAHVMDGQALEFETNSFDLITSVFGISLFPDYKQGLREMCRVLKPGGTAAVVTSRGCEGTPLRPWLCAFEKICPEVFEAGLGLPPGFEVMGDEAGVTSTLQEAGFEGVEVHLETQFVPVADADMYAERGMCNPLIGGAIARLPEDVRSQLVAKVKEVLRRDFEDGRGGLGVQTYALVAIARKPAQ